MRSPPPLVSCLMPTRDRRPFVARAARLFQQQDYPSLELLVLDDGPDPVADALPPDPRIRYLHLQERLTLGDKRNRACAEARGDILVHWDDDDWYPPHRVRAQVEVILGGADLSGSSTLHYWDPAEQRAYRYTYAGGGRPFLAGNTLAYRRAYWERHPFPGVDVGEDARFLWAGAATARIHDHRDPDLCIATLHRGNTSPKIITPPYWSPAPREHVLSILGADLAPAPSLPPSLSPSPLVTCVMPTGDRRAFIPLAVARFLAQDYPEKEMIVIDDGADDAGDLLRGVPGVRHLRLAARASIGHKRNLACEAARGEIIVQWDDDDWYGPSRIRRQVEPILAGRADITGLYCDLVFDLRSGLFWSPSRALHARMFHGDVHGGTLAFARRTFTPVVRYPDRSLAEDAMFLRRAMAQGARLERVDESGCFIYVRHGANAWAFEPGRFLDPGGWSRAARPSFLTDDDIEAYRSLGGAPAATLARPEIAGASPPRPRDDRLVASFHEQMGYRLGLLERGVSSHHDRFWPFLALPPELDGKAFTQLSSAASGPIQIRYHGPGPLHLLVPEGADESIEVLEREAVREPWPLVIARRGSAYRVWRVEGPARSFTVPGVVILVAERLARGERT